MNYGTCRSCGGSVFWTRSAANDKPMPVQVDDENGNVLLDDRGVAHAFADHDAAVAAMDEREDMPMGETYIVHHAVCPKGQEWRGKKRGEPDAPSAQGTLEV